MKKVSLIFIFAFAFNFIWENFHSYLYEHYKGGSITQFVLFRATLFDAILITILGLFFLKIKYLRRRLWYVLIIGFVAAILIEVYALNTGRWAYNEFMPIIPIIKIGLTPTLQLGLLSYLIFKIVGLKEKTPK